MNRINHSSRFIEEFQGKGYQSQKLNSFAQVVTGSTPSRSVSDYWLNGTHPWVSAQDMGDKFVDATAELVSDSGMATCKLIPAGSLLYVCRGSIGVMSINRIDCATNQSICSAICDVSICKTEYLYYWLLYHEDEINSLGEGTSFKSLSQKTFASLEIQIPPIKEQLRFIEITRQADKSKFNGFKSRFIEMFGDPNSNPRCLPTGLVSDCFTLQMGKTPARDTARYWVKDGSGNKWISIADMSRYEYFTNDTEEYISESAIQETGMKLIPKNIVIMSFKLTIGRVSVTSEPIYSNEAIVAFIPKTQDYSTRFLYYLVKYYDWLENAALAVKGKTLNKESIGKNRLIIPSREPQNEFATFAEQADKSKYLN